MRKAMRMVKRRVVPVPFFGALLLIGIGCNGNDEIVRTTEPRTEYGKSDQPPAEKVSTRILGAIADAGDGQSWFFKIMGPAEAVAKEEEAFDSFLKSVQFNNADEKPSWTLPEGWRAGPKKDGRQATLLIGTGDKPLDMSVIRAGGALLDNINRWRGQVGLPDIKQDELNTCSKEVTTSQGKKLTRVDLTGVASEKSTMPPFMGKNVKPPAKSEKVPTRILGAVRAADEGQSWFFKMMGPAEAVGKQEAAFDEFLASTDFADKADKPVSWKLPEGWRDGPAKPARFATLLAGPRDKPVELSIMKVGGGLLENINRWRAQVGLPPVDQRDLQTCSKEVTTKQGKKLTRVDLTGMAAEGPAMMPPFMR
jgi:hypothetical protein